MFYSHYHKASETWFDLTNCETCNSEIAGVNPVKVRLSDLPKLLKAGVKVYENGLSYVPEGSYDDETDMEVCECCP